MNKSEIELAALSILRERKALNKEKARFLLEEARKNKEFAQNEKDLRAIELDIAKLDEEENLLEKKKKLLMQRKNILKSLGISEEYLEGHVACKDCNDTGYINGKQCKCLKKLILAKLLEASGIETRELKSFKDFDETIATDPKQQATLTKYKKLLLELADKFPNQKTKCITVCGYTGTGKTFGSKCLMREVLKKHETVLFVTAFELSSLMLKYHTAFANDKNAIMDTLLEPELLVIDDLGTEPMLKNVTIEYLYVIISERLERKKTTFITTNLGLDNILDRYGERIFSRITDKKQTAVIKLDGEDLRHKK